MPKVILIGPPGAGKSSVARALSRLTELGFRDTDHLIEAETGKKIPDIFLETGEAGFREIESAIVQRELAVPDGILALGGGSVLDHETQLAISKLEALIVFLDVSISNAAPRVGFNKDRPLLLLNPRQQWLSLMELRRPIYEKLASIKVNTDNRKPSEVANEIFQVLEVTR